jgi:hypothetical protein
MYNRQPILVESERRTLSQPCKELLHEKGHLNCKRKVRPSGTWSHPRDRRKCRSTANVESLRSFSQWRFFVMDRYMPVTGIDCIVPSLLIDTEAPLDVLHETAAYRIRTATQLLESFALGEGVHSELARVLVTSLRDGCDLMDVIGRRLQVLVSA